MQAYSTREAAKKLGISWGTLNKFIALKQIPMPPVTRVGGVRVRLWSDADIAKVREVLPKIQNGRKTRYKKQSALSNSQLAKPKSKTRSKSKKKKT
jgi:predicted DNA-binding transcriptional regulator AlpA